MTNSCIDRKLVQQMKSLHLSRVSHVSFCLSVLTDLVGRTTTDSTEISHNRDHYSERVHGRN